MAKAKTRTITRYRFKKRGGHRPKFTLPIAVVAGFMPGLSRTLYHFQTEGIRGGSREMGRIYLGYDSYDGTFHPNLLWYGLAPVILGTVVHRFAGILGINRALARSGIPFVRF